MVAFAIEMGWGGWEWSLRVTPPIAILCIILLMFVMPNNIPRGYSDGIVSESDTTKSNYMEDIKYLLQNKSFLAITAGKKLDIVKFQPIVNRSFNQKVQVLWVLPLQWVPYQCGFRNI